MKTLSFSVAAGLFLQGVAALAQGPGADMKALQADADALSQQLRDEWRLNREKLAEIKAKAGADPVKQSAAQTAEARRFQAKTAELSAKHQAAENRIAENLKQRWQEVDSGWKAEVKRYDEACTRIENDYPPPAERTRAQQEQCKQRLDAEDTIYRDRSAKACAKRDAIHADFKAEVNRQVEVPDSQKGAKAKTTAASQPLKDTLGNKATTMNADLDCGAGTRTVTKAEKLMNKMGIPTKNLGGVLEAQGNFNLTINTEGAMGPVGSSAHQAQVKVGAMHKETYLSETSKLHPDLKREIATLDHTKKTVAGRAADPSKLLGKSELGQSMVKGTLKAVVGSQLPLQDVQAIMDLHGIQGTPEQFLEKMGNIKTRNLEIKTTTEAKQLQAASDDLLTASREHAKRGAQKQLAINNEAVPQLEAQAEDRMREAKKMRESKHPDAEAKAKRLEDSAKWNQREADRIRTESKDYLAKREASAGALKRHETLPPEAGTYHSGEPGESLATKTKRPKSVAPTPPPVAKAPTPPPVAKAPTIPPVAKAPAIPPVAKAPTIPPVAKAPTIPPVAKAPTPLPVAKPAMIAKPEPKVPAGGSKVIGGAGFVLAIYGLYTSYDRACLETPEIRLPERADGKGSSQLFKAGLTLSRGGAIAMRTVWNGLGFADAQAMGEQAGNEVAEQYKKDVLEGRVDPNDAYARAMVRVKAVGLGFFRFGKAMTVDTVTNAATESLHAHQELAGVGEDLYKLRKAGVSEEENKQFRAEMIYKDLRQRGVSETMAQLAADEAAQDNYWRARELRRIMDARNARQAQAARPTLAAAPPPTAPAPPPTVSAPPPTAPAPPPTAPLPPIAQAPPVPAPPTPLPGAVATPGTSPQAAVPPQTPANPATNPAPSTSNKKPTEPAVAATPAKAPDVIGPRAPTQPPLSLPAEVVYGTSQLIPENDWKSGEKPPIDTSRHQDVTPALPTPEELAAVQNAGKSTGTVKVGQRSENESRGKQPAAGTKQSVSPLEEGIVPANPSPPAPAPQAPEKPAPPATSGYRYHFKSSPEVRFEPADADTPMTKITFTRIGRVSVWMDTVGPDGKLVAETAAAVVNVIPPTFSLALQPPSGAKIGQDVEVTINSSPAIPAELLDFRWLEPAQANRLDKSPDGSRMSFKVPGQPVALHVLARVPHFGDALGEIRQTYTGSPWTLAVSPVRSGPLPKEFSSSAGRSIDPNRTFITDEMFTMKAELQGPNPPTDIRWQWQVNDGTSLSSPSVSDPTVSRHEVGVITATVDALDPSGTVLARGSAKVQVIAPEEASPLKVVVTLDPAVIEIGQSAQATAEVTGGKGPYEYRWHTGVSVSTLPIPTPDEGLMKVSVTVWDALKQTATASATLDVKAPQLTLNVTADRPKALVGESIGLNATASGGRPPYQFNWISPTEGTGTTGKVLREQPGPVDARVSVTDSKGRQAHASTRVEFTQLALALQGLKETALMGSSYPLFVTPEVPAGMTVRYSAVPSCPVLPRGNAADIRFEKAGTFSVHAELIAMTNAQERVVASSAPVNVTVAAKQYQIVLASPEVPVGAPATAKVVEQDGTAPADVVIEWTLPATLPGTPVGNSTQMVPDAPGTVELSARIKNRTTSVVLGEAKAVLKVVPLAVTVALSPAGGDLFTLKAWVPGNLPNVGLSWQASGAELEGSSRGTVVKMRVKPGAHAIGEVVASNARGIEIGRGKVTFEGAEVLAADKDPQALVQKGYQLEQAGDLPGACTAYEKAIALVADARISARLALVRQKMAEAQQDGDKLTKAQELLKLGFDKESAGDTAGALANYEAAQKLSPDARIEAHMSELRNKIAQAKAAPTEDKTTGASTKDQELQPSKQPEAENPRITQIHAELLRLGNEGMEIANRTSANNPDAMMKDVAQLKKIQSQVEKLKAELEQLEAGK